MTPRSLIIVIERSLVKACAIVSIPFLSETGFAVLTIRKDRNKCGFHAVEFFNRFHPDPHDPETGEENTYEGGDGFDGMFRFEKRMR